MRKLLATAAAIAPLLAATGVQAEVVISNGRTTPILTSNATGSAADNVRLATGGSIAVTSGAAITLDSSNTVDLDSGSSITMANAADNATAILVNGGNTGSVTVGGAISITDSIDTVTDTDGDGDGDGPFAAGTNRAGIRVNGDAPFVGDVLVESTGSISVQGNQSAGILVNAPLDGDLRVLGSIAITGTDSYGVHTTGPITGDILLSGSTVTVLGENAVGVAVDGAVDGRLQIQSAISSTGYRFNTRPPAKPSNASAYGESFLFLEDLDADDLLQGGGGVHVGADIAGGILLDTAPAYASGGAAGDDDGDGVINGDEDDDGDGVKNSEDTDRDGDGILDANEGNASIVSYGSAPALTIGSASTSVTIGAVGTGDEAYGLINRGAISGIGVYDNVDANALVLAAGEGQTTTIEGGIFNSGTISASATSGTRDAHANSTAINVGAGVTTPALVNDGTITAQSTTEQADQITGVLIANGASLPSITNSGVISAIVAGEQADAVAIRDLSGTLTNLTNTGTIIGFVSPTDNVLDTDDDNNDAADEAVTGKGIAIDVSANTTGVTFIQDGVTDPDADEDNDADGDGVLDSDEPVVNGKILLGSGSDTLDIRNGQVLGDIAFGDGQDSLSISGGANYRGVLSDTDGLLDIDVSNGTLDARQTTTLNATDLIIGAEGDLIVTVDPANNTAGGFNVSGTATLADGAGLGVRFASLVDGEERFNIIQAGTLNYGAIDASSLDANSPYLFVVNAGADVAAGTVYVDARRRTSDEIGMIGVEASAYDAFYNNLDRNDSLLNAFLAQTGRDGFINLYEQTLPDHSGGPLLSLASGVDAVTRALTGRNATANPGETSAWLQEINFYADKDKTDTYGFRSEGFGIAGGVERGTGLGAIGVSVAFTSSDIEDPESEAEEVLSANLIELGLYWRAQGQYWTTWARAAGGYATFDATRAIVGDGLNLSNESNWNGFTLAMAGGASYERKFGRFNVRPEAYVEYFGLHEEARSEEGGGAGMDLDLDERDGHMFSAVAAINLGYGFGSNGWIRPEVRLGWRQNISVDVGETIGRFVGDTSGSSFTLDPMDIEGGGPIAGFRLSVGNELGMLSINADAEMIEDYVRYTLLLRASFKF